MIGAVLANVLLLGQLLAGQELLDRAAPEPAQATTQQAAPTSAPASATAADTPAAHGNDKLLDVLSNTRLGRMARGEYDKPLTWQDLKEPNFWVDTVKELIVAAVGFIPRLFLAIMFFGMFWLLYRGIRRLVVGPLQKGNVDSSIRDMLGALIKWGIMGFGLIIACNQIGVQITALLTGVSLVGLAIGFAAQETLANFIAGVVIFWDKPFRVGDWVEVNGVFGQIQRVTFRSTRILDLDGCVIVIPNTQVLSNQLSNHSTNPINRVNIPIGIAYKESIDDARAVLLKLVEADIRILKDPPPSVIVKECADSSVNLLLRLWIADESVERAVQAEYLEKAKNALDAAGIQIPFPHMQLFIENTPGLAALTGDGRAARQPAAN